jgi:hypothetical protein
MILAAAKVEGFLDDEGNPTAAAYRNDDDAKNSRLAVKDAQSSDGPVAASVLAKKAGGEEPAGQVDVSRGSKDWA